MADEKKDEDKASGSPILDVTKAIINSPIVSEDIRTTTKQIGRAGESLGLITNAILDVVLFRKWALKRQVQSLGEEEAIRRMQSVLVGITEIPEENQQSPNPRLLESVIEGVFSTTSEEENLRGMFANLLKASCDSTTADAALPSYAKVISEMSALEANALVSFLSREQVTAFNIFAYKFPSQGQLWPLNRILAYAYYLDQPLIENLPLKSKIESAIIANLIRHQIIQVVVTPNYGVMEGRIVSKPPVKSKPKMGPRILSILEEYEITEAHLNDYVDGWRGELEYESFSLSLTPFGRYFCSLCIPGQSKNLSYENSHLNLGTDLLSAINDLGLGRNNEEP